MSGRNRYDDDHQDDDIFHRNQHHSDAFMFNFGHFGHHDHHHSGSHHQHHHLPATLLNATLDGTATDGAGHTLNGGGNPASGWEIQNRGSFQLAADVHYRQGDTVQPDGVTADGYLVYSMPAGSQVVDPAHHVPVANANRAATSFDWSFDTGVGSGPHQTIQQFLSSGGQFIVKIDLDPGQDNDPLVLHAVYDATLNPGGSHVVWKDAQNHVLIADDGGNAYVTQNSQNYAFYQSLIDVNPHLHGVQTGPIGPNGVFDIEEQIVAPHHDVIADIHSVLQIGTGELDTGDHDLPVTQLNATLAANATDGAGHTLNGAGNPASGWEIQNNGSFQLATDVHYRQGVTVQPAAVTENGTLVYNMPAGSQVVDPAHGVSTANAARAATSFDWSFDTGAAAGPTQTIQQFLAHGGQFIFKIDLDPGPGNDPLVLHAVYDPTLNAGGSHVVWQDEHNHVLIADDGGNAYVTQNSQNYAFYQSLIDTDPHTHGVQTGPVGPAGTFDIEAQIVNSHHQVVADIHSSLLLA
ncbi:MAG: hypothetical protein JSR72_17490 [Proteobacteria bacterium]|nr:hypothetical protein [Pseudomonadota bacterium]